MADIEKVEELIDFFIKNIKYNSVHKMKEQINEIMEYKDALLVRDILKDKQCNKYSTDRWLAYFMDINS